MLTGEKEVLGFYITGHPMQKYSQKLLELGTVLSSGLAELPAGKEISIGGVLTSVKVSRSKRGDLWASGSLEDLEGKVDLLVFPEAYKRVNELLKPDTILLVKGKVQVEEGSAPRVNVAELRLLEKAEPALASAVIVRVRLGRANGSVAQQLFELIERKPGQAPIRIELEAMEVEYTATGVRYTSPRGQHDDCVMALALAVHAWSDQPGPGIW